MSEEPSKRMKFMAILMGISFGALWAITVDGISWIVGVPAAFILPAITLANPRDVPPRILTLIGGIILLPLLIWVSVNNSIYLILGRIAAATRLRFS